MDNDENDFVNFNIKKKKTKRNKNVLKNTKTCAIYGIFDCTCCKKNDSNDSVIDETINQPSTSRLSTNEDEENIREGELLDDIIDVGVDYIPSTLNISSLEEIENNEENCDRTNSTNEATESPNNTHQENEMDPVFEETSADAVENSDLNISNEILSENNTLDETADISTNATIATTSESISAEETIANTSITSDVSLLTAEEEEEEIDVVNIPVDDTQQSILINNNQTENAPQEITQQNEIKTEQSDDENQIIDIINFDDTDHRENLVNNLTNMESTSNMGSAASNTNEDDIIDVEENDPLQFNDNSNSLASSLRRRRLKRRIGSQITINFHKRPRVYNSVMTIDLINATRDDSIIEISDSPVVPRKVTEIINVDDDDDDPSLNNTCSPRIGLGTCPVCLEALGKKEIMSTICGHVYCARCIKNVIKTTKKCPNCRKNLTLKSIHPLFI